MRIIRTIKKNKYVTFRGYNPSTKKQFDISCGREGSVETEQKYNELEQSQIRQKISEHRKKLRELTVNYVTINEKNSNNTVLSTNKIINADAKKTMEKIPSNSIHMAITSPPYNVGLDYSEHGDNMDYDSYLDWLETVFRELYRILVDGGRFALNIAPTGIGVFKPIHHDLSERLRDIGFIFRAEILWYKQNIYKRTAWGSWKRPSNPHVMPSWEYVFVYSKDNMKLNGDSKKSDITTDEFKQFSDAFWHIQPETKRNGHPAPFPEDLIYRLIKYYTYKNNIILDMFGGTGTTALVAHKTKREFIHIDTSKEYCNIAQKRIMEYDIKNKIKSSKLGLYISDDHLLQTENPLVNSDRRGSIKTSIKKSKIGKKTRA